MGALLSIACGGALGAMARYGMIVMATALLPASFPWGIIISNILGSFLMGGAVVIFTAFEPISEEIKQFLTIGFLGAFTTFSTYSFNIIELWEKQAYSTMMFYAVGSVLLSVAAVIAGMVLTKMVLA